jgi:hypothetical protein
MTGSGGAGGSGGMAGSGGAGGAGGGTCTTAGVIPLMDAFNGDVIDGQWSVVEQNDVTVTQSNGSLIVDLADQPVADTYGGVYSTSEYDLTNCAVFASAVMVPDPASHGYAQIAVGTPVGYVEVLKDGSQLYFKSRVNNVFTTYASVPYDATMHLFWQIRESAGVTYWETSPDAQSWTVRASAPDPVPYSVVSIGVAAGTYQDEPISPGDTHFDGVNVFP